MPTSFLHRPHHDGSDLYVRAAHPALGDTVSVYVRAPTAAGVRRVHVRSTPDGEPHFTEATPACERPGETWWRAELVVRNPVTRYRFLLDTRPGPRWLTAAGVLAHDTPDSTDFRLVSYEPPPDWAADAVVYQIFPDRFARSARAGGRARPDWAVPCDWDTPVIGRGPETPHQFYGGDLDGIVEHLDHIAGLGVTAVYLTPIFPARSNHRYDAASFDHVDDLLGGDAALARLAAAVHARGLRLLGDLTTNHCGDNHPWLRAALADPDAPERDLFYFDGGDYESWLGVKSLPKLNWASPELRRRFVDGPDSIAQRWLRPPYQLDGWRVDVANMTGRRGAQDDTHAVARTLRAAATRARPDALLVAEHAHDGTGDLDRDGWHGTMNYAGLTRPLWSWLGNNALTDFLGVPGPVPRRGGRATVDTIRAFSAQQSWRALTHSWTMLGSHDTARLRTVVGDPRLVEVAVGLLCTLPGVPMIFAGDELGLEGVNGEDARRPMPWDRPETWSRDTLAAYRALIGLRAAATPLRRGGLRWAHVDEDTLVFLRETADDRLLVLARRADGYELSLAGVHARSTQNLYGGAAATPHRDGSLTLPGAGPTIQLWRLNS